MTKYCSFCGKAEHEVFCLIAGPRVFICDECVILVADVVQERRANIARGESQRPKFRTLDEFRKDRSP